MTSDEQKRHINLLEQNNSPKEKMLEIRRGEGMERKADYGICDREIFKRFFFLSFSFASIAIYSSSSFPRFVKS